MKRRTPAGGNRSKELPAGPLADFARALNPQGGALLADLPFALTPPRSALPPAAVHPSLFDTGDTDQ